MFMIYPYTQNSAGAIGIAEELDGKRILRQGSTYKQKDEDIVINWGDGDCPQRFPKALNAHVMDLINKKAFFNRLNGTGLTPPFALNIGAAKQLGYPVFCRTTVEGQDGQGIVIADKEEELASAGLYVKGIDKTSEYRVHVGRYPDGNIAVMGGNQKYLKAGSDGPKNPRIWTGDGTFLGDFLMWEDMPKSVVDVAIKTMIAFPELTFAGLDIIYDNSEAKAYVIEGNSAPMMTSMTVYNYGRFFKKYAAMLEEPKVTPSPIVQAPVAETPPPAPKISLEAAMKVPLEELIQCYIQNN